MTRLTLGMALMAAATFLPATLAPASTAGGQGEGDGSSLADGVMTYAVFERSVDHADLDSCPEQFDPDQVFCRLTLAAEMAHVFVFAFDGEQPLVAVEHYDLDDDFLPF
jgi:hypothetical protein